MNSAATPAATPSTQTRPAKRTLVAACLAHATHDGLSDLVYVFLPVWQERFLLSFTLLSLLRSAYSLTLAALQIPASSLAMKLPRPEYLLIVATVLTGIGWFIGGLTDSVVLLGLALVVSGIGASTQHPIASAMVSRAYGRNAKKPLGVYNFAGDLGKSLLPAGAAFLLTYTTYSHTVSLYAGIAVLSALLIALLLRAPAAAVVVAPKAAATEPEAHHPGDPVAFYALLATGILDSAVRMGFLTFLPFILKANGASLTQTGIALTLVFIGGAVGKFVCGWLSESLGIIKTVFVTELATALLIAIVLFAPLGAGMLVLPLLGAVLNGTSSVLYGAVADVVDSRKLERAFAIFYTGTIGSGALAPVLYGYGGDHFGVTTITLIIALTAVVTLVPVTVFNGRQVREHEGTRAKG
ncbi:MFS family permease [Pseudomonas sp. JUb42]|jgi:MFS family permease|uniref:MFS transporter n=1 Tax=Pseudomonas sp. JUb42 TaxID=2940611 RepID=UPI0021675F47|nr:MFS transporter [Pseudomonas sp. JUb42]MCS3471963.1 MFS family permease [Pseudomonas sp. JUb42]